MNDSLFHGYCMNSGYIRILRMEGCEMNVEMPIVICPGCKAEHALNSVLTSQSNQNVIFDCRNCGYQQRNIETSKG